MMCRCRINMCSQSREVRHTSCGAHILDFIDIKAIDTHNRFPRNLHTVAIRTRRRLACVSGALRARWFLGKTHVMGRASLLAVKTGFSWEGRGGEGRGSLQAFSFNWPIREGTRIFEKKRKSSICFIFFSKTKQAALTRSHPRSRPISFCSF